MQLRGLVADTRPFGNEHFRRLWLANVVTVVGAQLTVVAVPAQIYEITGSSAYVGLTGLFGLVPLVVFGLYGGALADVMDRRTLLVMTTVGLILTSGAFWLQAVLGLGNVWLLLGLFAVQQAFFAVNQPTRSAILPKLVPTDQLPAANSLNMTVFQAGGIAGPLVGGALIPVLGYSWLYLVDTVTLLATLAAVVKLPSLRVESPGGPAGWRSVVDGFRYLRGHPILLTSFLVDIIAMVFGMPRALFPEIAHLDFGGPESGGLAFALLFAAIPAGAVLGGIFSGWVSRVERQGFAVIVAIVLWGLAMVGFGIAVGLAERQRGGLPGGGRVHAGPRRRGRHGVGGVPGLDAPGLRERPRPGPAPGHLHRGGGGRSAGGRHRARCVRGPGRDRSRGRRGRRAGRGADGRGGARRAGVRAVPDDARGPGANLIQRCRWSP